MNGLVILGDTNVAYNLYFFISQDVIPSSNIVINSELFAFHPIVLEEVDAHIQAWIFAKELGYDIGDDIPSFFKELNQDVLNRISKFVEVNLASLPKVINDSAIFVTKRKIYESVRLRLQTAMKASGASGKKVTSTPSLNDYKILFSAETQGHKISTNDGILLEISKEILESNFALNTEGVLKAILINDPSKKSKIEEGIKTLEYLGRHLNRKEIF